MDYPYLKNFCSIKDAVNRARRKATDQKKTFTVATSDKGLLPKNLQRTLKTQQ